MKKLRNLLLVAAMLITAAAIAGCGSSSSSSTGGSGGGGGGGEGKPKAGGTLTMGLDGDANTLDPSVADTLGAAIVEGQVFNSLLGLNEKGEYVPELATKWKNPDPKTLVLKLREGVKFQDGTPFDAEAVKWNLDDILGPKSTSSYKEQFSTISSVKAVDKYTVKIELKEPYTPLLSALSGLPGMMRSPAAVDRYGKQFGSHPVGTGPFAFEKWIKNNEIVLVKNADYWEKGKPYLEKTIFKPISDPTAKINDLISGQLQTVDYVPPEQIERLEDTSGFVVESKPAAYNNVVYMPMNTRSGPTEDQTVRQAINLAIDREAIVESVVFGAGEAAKTQLAGSSWAVTKELPAIPYDPEKAKELLKGQSISLELIVPPSYPQVAQVIQQNLEEVGINVSLHKVDWSQAADSYFSKSYQIMLFDQLAGVADPAISLGYWFSSTGQLNATGYANPKVDELLAEAAVLTDQAEREKIYTEVQKIGQEEAPYAPIYHPKQVRAWVEGVNGMTIPPSGETYLSGVWVE